MSCVLQQQYPQVGSRECSVSLPHSSSFNVSSSPSNLTFGSRLHQRSLTLPHKSNASPFRTTRILAAYSGDSAPPPESPAKALRRILELPGVHQGPACFDGLSAKLVERAGFQYCFTSGFSISAARLGLPDTGFLSYGEMVDQGQQITQAVSIPVIGDGDNGYGNAMNVKRTVKGYIRAGFAGILLEDQVMSVKALGTALKLTFEGKNQLIYPETWFFVLVVTTCVITQMNYLNKALDTFNTAVVSPIYYVMFTTLAIIASVIMFKDWDDQSGGAIISEICGFIVVLSGTILLHSTKEFERSSSFKGSYMSVSPSLSARLCSGNGDSLKHGENEEESFSEEISLRRQELY